MMREIERWKAELEATDGEARRTFKSRSDNFTTTTLHRVFYKEVRALMSAIGSCHNPKNKNFKWYGALGVKVHPLWMGPGGARAFLEHIGPRPSGMVLGRVDRKLGYVPGNVAWMTMAKAMVKRCRTHLITIGEVELSAAEWARKYKHTRPQSVTNRIQRGWNPEVAVKTPAGWDKTAAHERMGIEPVYKTAYGSPKKVRNEDGRSGRSGSGSKDPALRKATKNRVRNVAPARARGLSEDRRPKRASRGKAGDKLT